ncbi:MAG: hypothetical protein IPM25_06435 [Chloracidobacterium sp.]|nr:hypothetical protein [Chloracidobacterium sp.]
MLENLSPYARSGKTIDTTPSTSNISAIRANFSATLRTPEHRRGRLCEDAVDDPAGQAGRRWPGLLEPSVTQPSSLQEAVALMTNAEDTLAGRSA